jgi:hypothetical protein
MTVSAPVRTKAPVPAKSTRRPEKPGKRIAVIAVIIVWQLIALLFVEGILYCAGLGEEDIFQLDRKIGFTHFPNKRVTWRSEGYSQSYFDSDGMRDPGLTIAKPAGVYRIALLGDSMVEGLQVPIEETFGKQVEKQLSGNIGRPIQVLNFGNSGYSTAQEYLQLQRKVLKYKPDLVVLGYMSRDMFENWTPPDQSITNVRPFALHLPGQKLIVDSSPVATWMRSPRAKFLLSIQWLRNYSRIWGLLASTELQMSLQDPVYKAIVSLCTNPGKTLREWADSAKSWKLNLASLAPSQGPSFKIRFFEGNTDKQSALVQSSINRAPQSIPNVKYVTAPQLNGNEKTVNSTGAASSAKAKTGATATAVDPSKAKNGNKTYVELMTHTMDSLLLAMQDECQRNGARMAVLLVPCRAQLSPTPGMETTFFNITYADEIAILKNICAKEHIPCFDGEAAAETVPAADRPGMFYLMHMNAKGHKFLASKLTPFLQEQISR